MTGFSVLKPITVQVFVNLEALVGRPSPIFRFTKKSLGSYFDSTHLFGTEECYNDCYNTRQGGGD